MVDFAAVDWAVAIIALVGVVILSYVLIAPILQRRLMRCPEKGTVTFVDVDVVPSVLGDAKAPGLMVRKCDLWTEQQTECGSGCLERYGETMPGFRVDLHALRDFKRQ